MANALAASSSPYLRQHADNPVDWLPWGPKAFAEARRRDVPLLISIGYSTCHWCHVMAHESFEDAATAGLMNRLFVCVKVDREEHPEVDHIYMDAIQGLTGHGGWPLNAFALADGTPFFATTYHPRAAWGQLLLHLSRLWTEERAKVAQSASGIADWLNERRPTTGVLDASIWEQLDTSLDRAFDRDHPGLGWNPQRAPKFPPSQILALKVGGDAEDLALAESILEAMQDGGIHDRVGGGFHRYSVDAQWRMPHFEKMLYDNAQLITVYARAALRTGRADFLTTAVNAAEYLLRDLRVEVDGRFLGYATAEDADDPGGEGSFYAWSPQQVREVLGVSGEPLIEAWDLRDDQRSVGRSGHEEPALYHIPHPRGRAIVAGAPGQDLRASWEASLPLLRTVRAQRPRPGRDDKVLTDLNGLALEAFATLARITGSARFLAAARELAGVLIARHAAGGLTRLADRPACSTDYGATACGLLACFDATGDPTLVDAAERILREAIARLRDDDGGFWLTPAGRTDLVRRTREDTDNAQPSGQNQIILALVRLCNLTGDAAWKGLADAALASQADTIARAPAACGTALLAHALSSNGPWTTVASDEALLAAARRSWHPGLVAVPSTIDRPWSCLEGKRDVRGAITCVGTVCLAPALTIATLEQQVATLTMR